MALNLSRTANPMSELYSHSDERLVKAGKCFAMNSSHVSDADLLELELTRKRFAYSIGSLWSGTVGRSTIDPHWDFAEKSREAHKKFPVVEFVHSIRIGRRGCPGGVMRDGSQECGPIGMGKGPWMPHARKRVRRACQQT